jgi:leucyl aminopeptidase
MKVRSPLTPAFAYTTTAFAQLAVDTLIVPLWELSGSDSFASRLDQLLNGQLSALQQAGEFQAKTGESYTLFRPSGFGCRSLMLLGLGKLETATLRGIQEAAATALFGLSKKPRKEIAFAVPPSLGSLSQDDFILHLGLGASLGSYSGGLFQAKPTRTLPGTVHFAVDLAGSKLLERVKIEAEAVARCRDLVNLPPAELYPATFSQIAQSLATNASIDIDVWDEERLQKERMGGILGVGQGSNKSPRFVILRYRGAGNKPFFAFVGKGVTFDSGGLSMKTTEQMVDMKCDMAGAATVLSAMRAVAELKLPVNLLGCLPLVENMVNGESMKLGDVLTARNGKTIEVLNTDAEGRLILADALSYAVEQGVSGIVDLATLTGACMVALGTEICGLMTNNEPLAQKVTGAIGLAGERVWQLPMDADFDDLIKSNIADIKNVAGTRYGGATIAAKFLQHFVGETPWVHLDIAGPSYSDHESGFREAGATGAYVRSLIELARGLSE